MQQIFVQLNKPQHVHNQVTIGKLVLVKAFSRYVRAKKSWSIGRAHTNSHFYRPCVNHCAASMAPKGNLRIARHVTINQSRPKGQWRLWLIDMLPRKHFSVAPTVLEPQNGRQTITISDLKFVISERLVWQGTALAVRKIYMQTEGSCFHRFMVWI